MSATNPGFNFTKPQREKTEGQSTVRRLKNSDILPSPYPFWTRHAALNGMVSFDYNYSGSGLSSQSVRFNFNETKARFDRTPLVIAWARFGQEGVNPEDLEYSETSVIYKMPFTLLGAVNNPTEHFRMRANANSIQFDRQGLVSGDGLWHRVYFRFFVFSDDSFLNVAERTTFNGIVY